MLEVDKENKTLSDEQKQLLSDIAINFDVANENDWKILYEITQFRCEPTHGYWKDN